MKKFLLTLLVTGLGLTSFAETNTETITFSEIYSANTVLTGVTVKNTNDPVVGITFDKGNGSTDPQYYQNGTSVRFYAGNTFTVTADDQTITEITLTFGSSDGTNAITAEPGNYDSDTKIWSGNAKSITFSEAGTSGQRRISSIAVTYEVSSVVKEKANLMFSTGTVTVEGKNGTFTQPTLTKSTTAAVTYSSDVPTVATVNETSGDVTIVGFGTTTITASAAANDTYAAGSASYSLIVNVANPPATTGSPVTFDFTNYVYGLEGQIPSNSNSDYISVPATMTYGDVIITLNGNADGNKWRFYGDGLRAYSKGEPYFTVSTSDGKLITNISWTCATGFKLATNYGGDDITSWSGEAESVTLYYNIPSTESTNKSLATLTVTYSDQVAAVKMPVISFDSKTNTVSIECETDNSVIYYTTDGTEPNNSSTKYDKPFTITENVTVKAIAYVNDDTSSIASKECTYTNYVNTIGAINSKGDVYSGTATVTAQSNYGLILSDNTGSILYYNNKVDLTQYPIGTVVNVEGTADVYNYGLQLTNAATLTVETAGNGSYTYPAATNYTGEMITAAVENTENRLATYVSFSGTLNISTNAAGTTTYYNVVVDNTEAQGSLYYPITAIAEGLTTGSTYKFTGYYTSVSSSRYFNVVVTNVELVEDIADKVPVNAIEDAAVNEILEVSAVVTGQSTNGLILTDETGSILYYNPSVDLTTYPIGTQVDVKGLVSDYNNGLQLTNSATLKVTGSTTYTYPAPIEYTLEMIEEAAATTTNNTATYLSLEGVLSISGSHYNLVVEGATAQGSVYGATDAVLAKLANGNTYNLTGYLVSISPSSNVKYLNIVVTNVELIKEADNNGGNDDNENGNGNFTGNNAMFDFTDLSSLTAVFDGDPMTFSGEETEYNVTNVFFTAGDVTLVGEAQEGATSSNSPRLFLSNSANNPGWSYRFYNGNTITISVPNEEGYSITGIEFSASNLGNSSIVYSAGTYANGVWTPAAGETVKELVISKTAKDNNPAISTMTVYYTVPKPSGINGIYVEDGEVEVYTLQGVRVNPSNLGKGIYIIKNGDKTSKVFVR